MQAHINDFWVVRSVSGSATGNVTLAASNTVDAANGILVGTGSGGGTLTLGRTANTLLTNQLVIGQNYSHGLVKVAAGGTLTLGSAGRRATLIVGSGTTNTNETYTGKLDLTGGGAFSAHVGDLIVGQKDGGPGGETGTLIGGNGGAIDIGGAGNTANVYVGRTLSGGGSTGIVDFGGMASLTANLNTLAVGTSVPAAPRARSPSRPRTRSTSRRSSSARAAARAAARARSRSASTTRSWPTKSRSGRTTPTARSRSPPAGS